MMKKDISANLYQKRLILCSKILLNVSQYKLSSSFTLATYWVPSGAHGSIPSQYYRLTLATFGVPLYDIC